MQPLGVVPVGDVRVNCPLCGSAESGFERTVRGYLLERCRPCGFVFMNPQFAPERLDDLYRHRDPQELIDLYSRLTSPAQLASFDEVLMHLECKLPEKGRLLDFGCGPAYACERAAKRGWDSYGIDLGEWCKVAAENRGVKNVRSGYLQDQGFAEGFFDGVIALDVLEHIPQPKQELQQIFRVIRPGGWLLAQVPNYGSLSIRLGSDDFRLNEPPQHVNYFTAATLKRTLLECGYRNIDVTSWGGLKFENIIGKTYQSDITQAIGLPSESGATPRIDAQSSTFTGKQPIWKQLLRPGVDAIFYRYAKVGMGLRVLAQTGVAR